MSLFDDSNDDSIIELPVFERIQCRVDRQVKFPETAIASINDNNSSLPLASDGQHVPPPDDKSNETFTLDSDSEDDRRSNRSAPAVSDNTNDSIQVVFESPIDPNKAQPIDANDDNEWVEDNDNFADASFTTVVDANQSMRSVGSDWTPIKPNFINRSTPVCPKRIKPVSHHINSSLKKKSINCLNRKKTIEHKVIGKEDKERQKREKEAAKQRELAHKEVLKSRSLNHSVKNCIAIIDQNLHESVKQSMDELFAVNECNYRLIDRPSVPMSVTWVRKCFSVADQPQVGSQHCTDGQSQSSQASVTNTEVKQNRILVVIEMNDFIRKVHSFVTQNGQTIFDFVKQLIQKSNIKDVILLVLKLDNYYKRQKTKSQKQFRQEFNQMNATNDTNHPKRRQNNRRDSMPCVTKEEVDLALIDMEMQLRLWDPEAKVSVNTKPNDWSDVSTCIYRYTKAVAECEARQQKRMQNNVWYVEADNRSTVDPVDGASHRKLWIRQLMQFPKVSYDVANAIVNVYPSPQALLDAYSQHSSAAQLLLSDVIVVRRQLNGTNTERKVGRELSVRIHLFMTCRNGDQLLDCK